MNDEVMDIYSPHGSRVRYCHPTWSWDQGAHANRFLTEGATYTVDYTDVHSSSTDVYLVEFPGIHFNSCHFENVMENE